MKSIVFVTDVWGNINGVVTWLTNMKKELERRGIKVTIIHPEEFLGVPLLFYPDIKMSLFASKKVKKLIDEANPDAIHIATEGPLGLAARQVCKKNKWKFTSFYHTRLPEYILNYAPLHLKILKQGAYHYMRWFHNGGTRTLVGSPSLKTELEEKGFKRLVFVPQGIDLKLFKRNAKAKPPRTLKKPIFCFMGRLASEKNIEDFLDCKLPGSKLIIGDGPSKKKLQKKYKDAHFVGFKTGQNLVDLMSASDVYVFPSKTETFGLTLVEALACGLPVAAYNSTGPKDVIRSGTDGFLGPNLEKNALKCLTLSPTACIKKAKKYSWKNAADAFLLHS